MKRVIMGLLALALLLPGLSLAQGPRSNPNINTMPNDTSTGTTQYFLSKIVPGTGGKGKLIKAGTGDTAIELYICIANCGTSGEAKYMVTGDTQCFFDANNASGVAGQFVV